MASVRALVSRQPSLPFELRPVALASAAREDGAVQSVALVSNGAAAVSADAREPCLRVWSAVDGRCVSELALGGGQRSAVLPTSDCRLCVTATDGSPWTLEVWDLERGACVQTVLGTNLGRFMHLVLGPRDERAIALSYVQPLMDPDCKAWSITVVDLRAPGGARVIEAMRETYAVGSVAVHPDGRRAFIGLEGIVEIWDLDDGAQVGTLERGGWSPQLVLDRAGTRCIAGTREGRVVVWDVATGARTRELDVGAMYSSVQLLPGEQRCVTLGVSGPVRVWDLETGALIHELGGVPRFRADVAFDASGAFMLAKRGDDVLEVWGVETGALLASHRLPERVFAFAIARAPESRVRIAVGQGRGVQFFELRRRE